MLLEHKGTNAYAQLRISDVGSAFLFGRETSSYEKNIKDQNCQPQINKCFRHFMQHFLQVIH
jgi:tRNA(Leu) C34 or U34 (ribose-2'-O)-methylase TrmL